MTPSELYPGWKMTVRQRLLYFHLFQAACESAHASTATAKESLRQAAHLAAFGRPKSAKDIGTKKEFTAIANEFKRLANIVDRDDNARRTALFVARQRLEALRTIVAPGYVERLLKERFKVIPSQKDIENLSPKQLTDLITTVNNRIRMLDGQAKEATVEMAASGDPVW